jgi:Immunity protein 22
MSRYYGVAKEQEGTASVWLALEQPTGISPFHEAENEDEDAPISAFSEAFKFWYDHDFLETNFPGELTSVSKLLEDSSMSEAAFEAAKNLKIEKAFGVVTLLDHVYPAKKTKIREALGFVFLGAFSLE